MCWDTLIELAAHLGFLFTHIYWFISLSMIARRFDIAFSDNLNPPEALSKHIIVKFLFGIPDFMIM
jgi:hypothetical protein